MNQINQEPFVVGPDGERMTRADLPAANTRRWVPRRKARIVAAIEGGLITREAALAKYRLTAEELDSWRSAMARFGMRGLCVTKLGRARRTTDAAYAGKARHGTSEPAFAGRAECVTD